MGVNTSSDAANSVAMGVNAKTDAASTDSFNFGGVLTNAAGGVAIGSGASVTAANSVALGAGSVAGRANTVAVGNRQITDVVAGTSDLDAVNLKQLKDVSGSVADALGGAAGVDPVTGKVTQPTYTVGKKPLHTVGDAIAALDTGLDNAVQYDDGAKTSVTLKGAGGTQIHQVAAGTVDLDAVNLKQLKDAGLKTDPSGVATNAFVAYDDKTKKDSVTLEGTVARRFTRWRGYGRPGRSEPEAIEGCGFGGRPERRSEERVRRV